MKTAPLASATLASLCLAVLAGCANNPEAGTASAAPSTNPTSSVTATSKTSPSASAGSSASATATGSAASAGASATTGATGSPSRKVPTVTETDIPANQAGEPDKSPSPQKPAAQVRQLATKTMPDGSKVATVLSPSGNIACEIYANRAQCSVLSLGENAPRTPGQVAIKGWSYAVDTSGKVYDTGATQTPLATLSDYRGETLAYGQNAGLGQFVLVSEESGMTLRDTVSGHGATFNRDGITTF